MSPADGEHPAIVTSHRRRFIRGIGATGVAGVLAGCLGDDGDSGDDEENGDEENGDEENGEEANGDEENGDVEGEVTASFTAGPEEGKAPLEVEFDAADSSAEGTSIESYEWGFGDGNSDGGETVTHAYQEAGEYTAELTVTGEDESTDTASTTITVDEADVEPDVSIAQVTEAPAIDGSLDGDWETAEAYELPNVLQGDDDPETLSAEWRGLWDDENFSLAVDVTDDDIATDGAEPWENDGVEVYVTPRFDQSDSYGEDHAQFVYVFDDDEIHLGANSHDRTDGIEHASVETDDGYRIAVSMPWDTLGGTPGANDPITLDVHVNDNDGGGRDNKIAWNAEDDVAWQDPSSWGVVELAGSDSG